MVSRPAPCAGEAPCRPDHPVPTNPQGNTMKNDSASPLRFQRLASALVIAAGLSGLLPPGSALAQTYPTRPIRFIVPVAAGSTFDTSTRLIGEKLAQRLGQPVVVENQPGAGTALGLATVAKAAPDGYTIGLMLSPVTIQHSLVKQMPFDSRKDLAPVVLLGWDFSVLVVNPSVPVKTVAELIAHLKANPDRLNFASGGIGTPAHIAGEFFKQSTGTRMVHVPYKGVIFAVQDMLAGRVELMFGNAIGMIPQIKAGKLRALAVVGKERLALLPDVPSTAEVGYPEIDVPNWQGVAAPASTPPEILARLERELTAIMALPDVRERIVAGGTLIAVRSGAQMKQLIAEDIDRWAQVIAKANIKVE
ncbi:MAG: tripartite tricarboxylate transporter substrate binding protein [Betaproteobacteria bacterium]|nr:tripartite tricarboxylate transporter substrate binding protein [Betaproteobacteria bacterium]